VATLLDANGAVVLAVIVEVQRQPDPDKRFAWPFYTAALHARMRCPVCLLVIATTPAVARWARRPIRSFQPKAGFVPLVVGPEAIPRVTDPAAAEQAPELAVLSVLAHGAEKGAESIAFAAIA